jgi:hypothetical protein
VELLAALAHPRRALVERRAAARANLHLRRDQLADEVLFELGALSRRLELLEPVDERERVRVEDRELLLDRDREVARRLERVVREPDLLVRRKALCVPHRLPAEISRFALQFRPAAPTKQPQFAETSKASLRVEGRTATSTGGRGRRHARVGQCAA